MMRFMGMLTGILITTGLYFLYLNHNMQAIPASLDTGPGQAEEVVVASPSPGLTLAASSNLSKQDAGDRVAEPLTQHQQLSPDILEPETSTDSNTRTAVFWDPFHSRYSASGFARRITHATGIQVHILPADKHQYRVAFNYLDENDRVTKFNIIESITGLELTP
jgi:hypothetical protein